MKKKYLLITGCAGFIGSNFTQYVLSKFKNLYILGLDNLSYSSNLKIIHRLKKKKNFLFVKKNISNSRHIKEIFNKYNIYHVINFAAETHVDNSIFKPDIFIKTNVIGTFNLLNASKNKWVETKNKKYFKNSRFLQISTDEVYGSIVKGSFTENSGYSPNSPYSSSKASSDLLVRSFNKTYKLNTLITNSANNFGPYQNKEKFIPTIIKCCNKKKNIPIYGNGSNIRNWLFVKDNNEAIYKVFKKGKIGNNYNIGSNIELTNLQLVKKICDLYQKIKKDNFNYKSLINFVEDRKGHDLRYSLSIKKIKNEIGWKPKKNFENDLIKTIKFYITK